MPVSREDIVLAYRYILGREPEGEATISAHMQNTPDLLTMRMNFLGSEEAQRLVNPVTLPPSLPLDAPPLEVETVADRATLAELVGFTGRYWEEIGRTAPHWSVLTEHNYKPDAIAQHEAAFFATGQGDADLLLALLRRIGRDPAEFSCCAEYGCGVGRITTHLAKHFPRMQALDISRPHLDLAAETLRRFGQHNIEFHQVTPADVHPAQGFDLWYSRIVLQHNPPPIIMHILDRVFRLLEPGGVAAFQVPTYRVGYRFRIAEYLARDPGGSMEVHVVPQRAVLELAWKHRLRLADIREDTSVVDDSPNWLSNTFVFCKD